MEGYIPASEAERLCMESYFEGQVDVLEILIHDKSIIPMSTRARILLLKVLDLQKEEKEKK